MRAALIAIVSLAGTVAAVSPALADEPPAGASGAASIPETVDAAELPGYKLVSPWLAAAGQPTDAALGRLGAMGFRTVVTLRPEGEGPAGEQDAVEAQGLSFVRVGVTPATFAGSDVDRVAAILSDPARLPVLLHCSSANRAGAVVAVLEARMGVTPDEAIETGRRFGLTSDDMIAAVRRVMAEGHR